MQSAERQPIFETVTYERPPVQQLYRQPTSPIRRVDSAKMSDGISDLGKTFVNINQEAVRNFQHSNVQI
jgi:hypothetical protein